MNLLRMAIGGIRGAPSPSPPLFTVRKTYTRWEHDELGEGWVWGILSSLMRWLQYLWGKVGRVKVSVLGK